MTSYVFTDVPCPTCGAGVGFRCRRRGARSTTAPLKHQHHERVQASLDAARAEQTAAHPEAVR